MTHEEAFTRREQAEQRLQEAQDELTEAIEDAAVAHALDDTGSIWLSCRGKKELSIHIGLWDDTAERYYPFTELIDFDLDILNSGGRDDPEFMEELRWKSDELIRQAKRLVAAIEAHVE